MCRQQLTSSVLLDFIWSGWDLPWMASNEMPLLCRVSGQFLLGAEGAICTAGLHVRSVRTSTLKIEGLKRISLHVPIFSASVASPLLKQDDAYEMGATDAVMSGLSIPEAELIETPAGGIVEYSCPRGLMSTQWIGSSCSRRGRDATNHYGRPRGAAGGRF